MMKIKKNAGERNQGRSKYLERYTMFMDWKTQLKKIMSTLP